MSTATKFAQMIKDILPKGSVIEGSVEEREHDTSYGFSVTFEECCETPVLIPAKLEALRKKMKAQSFFIYPSRPVSPYEIRLYFYIVVEKQQ